MSLNTPIDNLLKTSVRTINCFKKNNILSFWDLLNYFPFRYENYSLCSPIDKIQDGEIVTIKGQVMNLRQELTRRGLKIQKILIQDPTGKIELVWYNQPFLLRLFKPGMHIAVSGVVKKYLHELTITPESYEIINTLDQTTIHTGRIVPVYPEKQGLSSRVIREKIFMILKDKPNIPDTLSQEIISYNQLIDEELAYQQIHFPQDMRLAQKARLRLSFDELFVIQLSSSLVRKEWQQETLKHVFQVDKYSNELANFIKNLPFDLTRAQKRSLKEIVHDLASTHPMNRFLQGDVGSGKTVIAVTASYLTYLNGLQSLFMAPTEILVNQHYQTVSNMLKNYPLKIGLQTGSRKIKEPKDMNLIIGTHALLNEKLNFDKVGLVVIDEQHRFGVRQRALLKKKGVNPHLLTMTATPIPRTVTLTLYGELDLSVIDEMPKGRRTTKTYLVPKQKRSDGYQWIKKQIQAYKTQVFVICPLIEESEIETMRSVKAASKEYEYLKKQVFPELKLGLLHGKMKTSEKNRVMQDFKEKKYDLLVSTQVVEVGIDIPNATIMLIETAERYGLAQLHQLRGRVGRGSRQSYCLLFTETEDEEILKRLKIFVRTESGIQLSEYDMRLRGPGDIYGIKQHGFMSLKIASLADYTLISKAKNAVNYFVKKYGNLDKFEELKKKVDQYRVSLITRD